MGVALVKVLGIRFCTVNDEAESLAHFFDSLGMPRQMMAMPENVMDGFAGAVFPAGESWIEMWQVGPDMPAGVMLQVVVDDADAFAQHAKTNGLSPQGPVDAHGERIYYLQAPTGLQMSFQSKLP
jgi:hypothetical protein